MQLAWDPRWKPEGAALGWSERRAVKTDFGKNAWAEDGLRCDPIVVGAELVERRRRSAEDGSVFLNEIAWLRILATDLAVRD